MRYVNCETFKELVEARLDDAEFMVKLEKVFLEGITSVSGCITANHAGIEDEEAMQDEQMSAMLDGLSEVFTCDDISVEVKYVDFGYSAYIDDICVLECYDSSMSNYGSKLWDQLLEEDTKIHNKYYEKENNAEIN